MWFPIIYCLILVFGAYPTPVAARWTYTSTSKKYFRDVISKIVEIQSFLVSIESIISKFCEKVRHKILPGLVGYLIKTRGCNLNCQHQMTIYNPGNIINWKQSQIKTLMTNTMPSKITTQRDEKFYVKTQRISLKISLMKKLYDNNWRWQLRRRHTVEIHTQLTAIPVEALTQLR
jgi:hypothetical protein